MHDPVLSAVDRDELTRTPLQPCPYLPGKQARFRAFLAERLGSDTYHELMDRGFRRNGEMFYATDCPDCRQCVPMRIDVDAFAPSRSQRRAMLRNRDLVVRVRAPAYQPASFDLYRRYLRAQHGTDSAIETADEFRSSLYARVVDTVEVTYSLGEQVIAISLLDVSARSVSAVYHFFEPDHHRRSLGVYSVLTEIAWTRQIGVLHYYLGYWIEGAATMDYKADYRPHELLLRGEWRPGTRPAT